MTEKRVLCVTDDEVNMKLIRSLLEIDKIMMLEAPDAETALEILRTSKPDLILMDIQLPGMDGYSAIRLLKQDPSLRGIPVIALTALDSSENRATGLEAGAEEFICKPVNALELQVRVNSMLRLKQYHDALGTRSLNEWTFSGLESPPESAQRSGDDRPTILIVEDDRAQANLVVAFLKDEPYQLEVVSNGADALTRALSGRIDAVILDILLPDINGFDICRQIKSSEKNTDIPIILVTCLSDIESRIKGIEMGSDDFLVKPLVRRELIARIRALLAKKKQVEALRSNYVTTLNSAVKAWLTGLGIKENREE